MTTDFSNATIEKEVFKQVGVKISKRKNYEGKKIRVHSIKEIKVLNSMWRAHLDSIDEEFKNIYYYKLERKQQYELRKVIFKNINKLETEEDKVKYIIYLVAHLTPITVLTIRESLANKLYNAIVKKSKYSIKQFESEVRIINELVISKNVNIAAENELGSSRVNTENLKSVISGDVMTINIKYQAPVEYTPMCKLIFLVNSLPNTSDATHGYFRKVMIVPFNRKFSEEERDVDLFDKLKANELPGILNWALEGLVRLRENNYKFSECDLIKNAMKEYEEEQNPVLKFIEQAIEYDENEKLSRKEILEAYNK